MHERRLSDERIYPTYKPYPVSWDSRLKPYATGEETLSRAPQRTELADSVPREFPSFDDEKPFDDWLSSESPPSNDDRGFQPLRLLESLFSDRLGLLKRALEELETAREERARLTREALSDLDGDILECEQNLTLLRGLLNDPERRVHLERRLSSLKRDRRHEALLSWRDIVWLRAEIRKLQREIGALNGTAKRPGNPEAPR